MLGLIGKKVKVKGSKNRDLVGISGLIVDETKKMLVIKTRREEKMVEKKICTFEIDGQVVRGEDIYGMPWERLKKRKKVRKRW